MANEENIKWWNNRGMLEGIYQGVLTTRHRLGLDNVEIIRDLGENYVEHISDDSVEIFSSDGNHSMEPTMRTVKAYLPKMRIGGVIIQDDCSWVEDGILTVKPAIDWLLSNGCEFMYEVTGAAFIRRVR